MGVVYILGLLFFLKKLYQLIQYIYSSSISSQSIQELKLKYGKNSYAVITGACDPLGRGFANQLAQGSYPLILIDSNKEKLQKLVAKLQQKHQFANIKTITFDFAQILIPNYLESHLELNQILQTCQISLLIHNAKVLVPPNQSFLINSKSKEQVREITLATMQVNLGSQTLFYKLLLEKFRSRHKNTGLKSGVIDIINFASNSPVQRGELYQCTRYYNDYLQQTIMYEYQNDVDFLRYQPGQIKCKFNYENYPQAMLQKLFEDANVCAARALGSLGKVSFTYGPLRHQVTSGIAYIYSQVYQLKEAINKVKQVVARKQIN